MGITAHGMERRMNPELGQKPPLDFHLLKSCFFHFPLLVLKGNDFTTENIFILSRGLKQMDVDNFQNKQWACIFFLVRSPPSFHFGGFGREAKKGNPLRVGVLFGCSKNRWRWFTWFKNQIKPSIFFQGHYAIVTMPLRPFGSPDSGQKPRPRQHCAVEIGDGGCRPGAERRRVDGVQQGACGRSGRRVSGEKWVGTHRC